MNSTDQPDDTTDNEWITRTFEKRIVSNILGHDYRTSTGFISPSGKYVAIFRYRRGYTLLNRTKRFLRINNNFEYVFKNKMFVLDLSDLSLKRYRFKDGLERKTVSYFCWHDDSSFMTTTTTTSSFIQKQYFVDHNRQQLIVSHTYESKIGGDDQDRLAWFTQFENTKSIEIQGIKFAIVRKLGINGLWLLPYKLNEIGPRYPPVYVRFAKYESEDGFNSSCVIETDQLCLDTLDKFYTQGSKIYFTVTKIIQRNEQEPRSVHYYPDVYYCCDLANLKITSTEMNFINTGNLYKVRKIGEHFGLHKFAYIQRVQTGNMVAMCECRGEYGEMRLWIWNMENETIIEHTLSNTVDFADCFAYKSLFFVLGQPENWESRKERNMLKFKILARGTKSTLADLCRRRIVSKPELYAKETFNMNHIFFKE